MNSENKLIRVSKHNHSINIHISAKLLSKMEAIVDYCTKEVGWIGTAKQVANGNFVIEEIYIPKQTVTEASVEAEIEMMSSIREEFEQNGKIDEFENNIVPNLRFFGHSHVNMTSYWSEVDERGINNLSNSGFLVSFVMNKRGDLVARVDLFRPIRIAFDDCTVIQHQDEFEFPGLKEELDSKITYKGKATHIVPSGYQNNNYSKSYYDSKRNKAEEEDLLWAEKEHKKILNQATPFGSSVISPDIGKTEKAVAREEVPLPSEQYTIRNIVKVLHHHYPTYNKISFIKSLIDSVEKMEQTCGNPNEHTSFVLKCALTRFFENDEIHSFSNSSPEEFQRSNKALEVVVRATEEWRKSSTFREHLPLPQPLKEVILDFICGYALTKTEEEDMLALFAASSEPTYQTASLFLRKIEFLPSTKVTPPWLPENETETTKSSILISGKN